MCDSDNKDEFAQSYSWLKKKVSSDEKIKNPQFAVKQKYRYRHLLAIVRRDHKTKENARLNGQSRLSHGRGKMYTPGLKIA